MNSKITLYSNRRTGRQYHALLAYLDKYNIPYEVVYLNDVINLELMQKFMKYYNAGFDAMINYQWRSGKGPEFVELRQLLNSNPTFNQLLEFCVKHPKVLRNNIMWIPHKKRILVGFTEQNKEDLLSIYVMPKIKHSNRKVILAKALEVGIAREVEKKNG